MMDGEFWRKGYGYMRELCLLKEGTKNIVGADRFKVGAKKRV